MIDSLHAFSRWLEDAATRHEHTISLLESLSTTSAVVVALWASFAAKNAARPRLRASVSIMLVIYGDGRKRPAPEYLTVKLTNNGPVPIHLQTTFFSWRLPFVKSAWIAQPIDQEGDDHAPQRRYPLVLLPQTSETVFLSSIVRFDEYVPGILDKSRLPRWLTPRFVRARVYADDGSVFRASLNKQVVTHLYKVATTVVEKKA